MIFRTDKDKKDRLAFNFINPLFASLLLLIYISIERSSFIDAVYTKNISRNILRLMNYIIGHEVIGRINIGEIFIVILGLYILISLINIIKGILTLKPKVSLRNLFRIINISSIIIIMFLVNWGFNYKAEGVAYSLKYQAVKPGKEDLSSMAEYLIGEAKLERKIISQVGKHLKTPLLDENSEKEIINVYSSLSNKYDIFKGGYYSVKPLLSSFLQNHIGISGFFNPFTGEAGYNYTEYELFRYASMYHEAAHSFGFAREDEASFVAYLVSREDKNPFHRYSVTMYNLNLVMNEVSKFDHEEYIRLRSSYSEEMNMDLERYEFSNRIYNKKVIESYEKVNDTYLRIQGTDGVVTYNETVEFLFDYLVKNERIKSSKITVKNK